MLKSVSAVNGCINHVVIVADASQSMQRHSSDLVKVTDVQVAHLAEASKHHDQETRITFYQFSSQGWGDMKCLVYDKDVLRFPSIAGLYSVGGWTALCDAMVLAIGDLKGTPQNYGDHSFLLIVLTDGEENMSSAEGKRVLPQLIRGLPDNWTLAAFVPDVMCKARLQNFGVPKDNIKIWDPSESGSLIEVGETIKAATEGYMTARAQGTRSTSNLFQMNAPSVADIKGTLAPLTPGSYYFEEVTAERLAQIDNGRIDQFMSLVTGKPYAPGRVYYQMFKRERIQRNKSLAVAVPDHAKKEAAVYVGDGARRLLGLPDEDVRVSPGRWKDYLVFVLSTSMNRKLYPGTKVLVMR